MSPLDDLALARFPLDPASVEIHTEGGPIAFVESLRRRIATATRRISLASLYWGMGDLERELVGDLTQALKRNSQLTVQIVLDHSRGRRVTSKGTSIDVLAPLLREFPQRASLYLHQIPLLRRWGWLPFSLNEMVGVCHIKAFAFDDAALLSGSNLSNDYFTCRQARVFELNDPGYALLMHKLVEVTAQHSPRALDAGGRLQPAAAPATQLASALKALVAESANAHGADTWASPVLQHTRAGLNDEASLLPRLLSDPEPELVLSTPYLNVPRVYQDALVARTKASERRTLFVSPAPESHGFAGGRGLKALIPEGYRLLGAELEDRLGEAASFRRYTRPEWVYHAKGLWLNTPTRATTIVGSSNFGQRSAARDFDQGTLITTTDGRLREALEQEVLDLLAHTSEASSSPGPWHHRMAARALLPLVRTFL